MMNRGTQLKEQPKKKGHGSFGKNHKSIFKVTSNGNEGETISLSKKKPTSEGYTGKYKVHL